MHGQNETKSPIVYSCSPLSGGSRPCPMVVRDHCRNCSARLIPPYSLHPPFWALRSETRRLLVHVRGNRSAQAFSNEADLRATFGQLQGDRSERGYWQTGAPATCDGLKNLALAFGQIMRDAKRSHIPARQEPNATAPATSRNSGSGWPARRHSSTIFCVPRPQRSTSPRR